MVEPTCIPEWAVGRIERDERCRQDAGSQAGEHHRPLPEGPHGPPAEEGGGAGGHGHWQHHPADGDRVGRRWPGVWPRRSWRRSSSDTLRISTTFRIILIDVASY